jgi:hypothetical protein
LIAIDTPAIRFHAVLTRAIAALVLAGISFVPAVARAHDRLDRQRTPAQEHTRFRWTNSCESVPQRDTTVVVVAPADAPAELRVERPPSSWRSAPDVDTCRPPSTPVRSGLALRAPPARTA